MGGEMVVVGGGGVRDESGERMKGDRDGEPRKNQN